MCYDKEINSYTDIRSRALNNIDIELSRTPIDYRYALNKMEIRVEDVHIGKKNELIWILEHKKVYTCGTSTKERDIPMQTNIDIVKSNRGGELTYHGPGQIIVYFVINLSRNKRELSLKRYIELLSDVVIRSMNMVKIDCYFDKNKIGVWHKNKKIASIGIRIRKLIAFHGLSLNVNPDMSYFRAINPCGLNGEEIGCINEIKPDLHNNLIIRHLIENAKSVFIKI